MRKKLFIALILSFTLLSAFVPANVFANEGVVPEALGIQLYVDSEAAFRDALAAITAAPPDDEGTVHEIVLTGDFDITGTAALNISSNRTVRISGEYTISSAAPAATTFINMGTVVGGVEGNSHLIIDGPTFYGAGYHDHGINFNTENNEFTLVSGRIENFAQNGIRTTSNARYTTVNIYDGYVTSNGTNGIIVDGRGTEPSRINIHEGATISGNGSWGIWAYYHVHIEMYGGLISGNQTGVRMGGNGLTTFNMHDGLITQNTRTTDGAGGVWVGNNSVFNMHGGYITHNEAPAGGGVRIGGGTTGSGHMNMHGGTIAYNTAAQDGGGIQVHGTSTLAMDGGHIVYNTAEVNGGGVHLQMTQVLFFQSWPTFNFQGGTISHNTAGNDGGGIWVNWTRVAGPATPPATSNVQPDLRLGDAIGDDNIHSNTSRQFYAITDADRNRLERRTPGGVRSFDDAQIYLWNNDQINYAGVALNYHVIYGVREGQGTISGTLASQLINTTLAPSPARISGDEQITFAATPAQSYYVRSWSVGRGRAEEEPVFFTQEELDELIANGYIYICPQYNTLTIINTGELLVDGNNRIYVFVYFAPEQLPTTEPSNATPSTEPTATQTPNTTPPITETPATEPADTPPLTEAPTTEAPVTEQPVDIPPPTGVSLTITTTLVGAMLAIVTKRKKSGF